MRFLIVVAAALLLIVIPAAAQEPEIQSMSKLELAGFQPAGVSYEYQDSTYDPKFDPVRDGQINVQDLMAVSNRWRGQADVSAHDRIKVAEYWTAEDSYTERGKIIGYVENGTPFYLGYVEIAARLYDSQGQLLASKTGRPSVSPMSPFSRSVFAVYFDDLLPDYDQAVVVVTDASANDEPIRLTVVSTTPTDWYLEGRIRNDTGYPVKNPGYTYWELDEEGRPYQGWWSSIGIADEENRVMRPGEIGTFRIGEIQDLSEVIIYFGGYIYLADHLN